MLRRAAALVALTLVLVPAAAAERLHQPLRFGVRVGPAQWSVLIGALTVRQADPANPVTVTLDLPAEWAAAPDWASLEAVVSAASGAGARLAVVTQLPGDPESEPARAYLVALSERVGRRADALGLSLSPATISDTLKQDPDRLALTLKRLSSALRGAGTATLYLGDLDRAALALLEPLYSRDLRVYVEGYGSVGTADGKVHDFLEKHHPGAPLWVRLPAVKTALGAQMACLVALSRGVDFADVQTADLPAVWEGLVLLRSALSRETGVGFVTEASGIWERGKYRGDVGVLNFIDAETFVQGMLLVANAAGSAKGTLEVTLPTEDITSPRACALPLSAVSPLEFTADPKKHETTLRVPWEGTPVLVLFDRMKTGMGGQGDVRVSGVYRMPVELILARHQAVQEAQDILLKNYVADAQVDYHFKLPGGTASVDVTFMNTFFFERGAGARWVQNRMLLNGVAWKGKTIPQLPVIEPEKVNSLPLALTLGRDYTYTYLRDEAAEGRECFLVEFIPLPDAEGSLYEGRVWIDRETYATVKMVVRQTALQAPQVSNEETDHFTLVEAPGGRGFHLLTRVVGQQIFSFMGRNVVAEREVRFTGLRLNAPLFREDLALAEASDRPMLQETEKGPRYLEKRPDGTRLLQMDPKTSRWLLVGGVYYDPSLEFPLPLAGVNYMNYDWRKTGTQVNLFAAGAFNSLTVSKADLFPKMDGRFDAVLFPIAFDNKFFVAGVEDEGQRIKVLREITSVGLGWRVTEFSKISAGFDAVLYRFSRSSKTAPGFVLPENHGDLALTVSYDYTRRGWGAIVNYEAHRRTAWEPWGPAGSSPEVSTEKAYALWDTTLSKTFYLPKFQKIGLALSWLDGRDLDRFSRYEFTYLGRKSLAGFTGSGVRFDRGATVRMLYEFNLANVVRFGVSLDHARVNPIRNLPGWQDHTGIDVSGSVAGPWKTLWSLDVGYALQSDIPAVKHDATVALIVLKLW